MKHRFIESHRRISQGWIRIFGYGFTWKDSYKQELLFSERNGYTKYLKLGKWIFKALSPMK